MVAGTGWTLKNGDKYVSYQRCYQCCRCRYFETMEMKSQAFLWCFVWGEQLFLSICSSKYSISQLCWVSIAAHSPYTHINIQTHSTSDISPDICQSPVQLSSPTFQPLAKKTEEVKECLMLWPIAIIVSLCFASPSQPLAALSLTRITVIFHLSP